MMFSITPEDCIKRFNLKCKCKFGRTPEELATDLAELAAYRALGKPEELVKVVWCGDCVSHCNCDIAHAGGFYGSDYCPNGERREV
jgi:hypothetical protein